MNGKEIKVIDYELKFGQQPRIINVFGVFKYIPNNSLYILYADKDTDYSYVSYGSSHVKDNTVLSMSCPKEQTEEVIKEYIYKVTNKEKLDNFEIIPLKDIDGVEIISSNKLEIKKEVLENLIKLTIPPQKAPANNQNNKNKNPKKKRRAIILLPLLIILIVLAGSYYYMNAPKSENIITKTIVCQKTYAHEELENVDVDEEKTYKFNQTDTLISINTKTLYNFQDEDSYLEFINKGLYYKYMPENEDPTGGWSKDDDAHTFKMIENTTIDSNYNQSTAYEDILATAKKENYDCNENIEK